MSVFQQNTATASAILLADIANAECANALRVGSSHSAHALASEFAGIPASTSELLWGRVESALPGWQGGLPATSVDALASARLGEVPIASALATVATDLGRLERFALADVSGLSLAALGYDVTRVDGVRTTSFEARRDNEVMLVTLGDGGDMSTDHAGVIGDACVDRQRDLMGELERRGVLLDEGFAVRHDRPEGGGPIAAAARAGGGSLAAGAVLVGDGTVSTAPALTTSLKSSATSPRTRRAVGGAR